MEIEALAGMPLARLLAGYAEGSLDPVAVIEATLAQAARVNPALNALYDLRPQAALAEAKAAALRWRRGAPAGPMDGVPVTIKDSIHAAGMHWHHGARLHGAGVEGRVDAPPAARLKAAGAIIVGKGTMPDFGLSASGVSSYHGIVRNPWNPAFSPGGSSAGGGASLAAGVGMLSVGTDIAGSVRLPASHCGLAALKPTQGLIAHVPASDVRAPGPMVRHAADLEPWLRVLAGVDPADRFSVPLVEPGAGFGAATVRLMDSFGFGPAVAPEVGAVLAAAAEALAPLVGQVVAGAAGYDFDAYLPIDESLRLRGWREHVSAPEALRGETPAALLAWIGEAGEWDGARVARIEAGLARGVAQSAALLEGADFLLTPVMPLVNFPAERLGPDPAMPLRHCTFTAPFNQSGHPAVALCAGFDPRGLPVGVQLVARRFDDIRLCRLAARLEAALWSGRPRPAWPLTPRPPGAA